MPAYLIVTCVIHDRDAVLAGYAKSAAALTERHGGRYVLRAPGGEVLEGAIEGRPSVVISQWPSKEAALAFWNSDDYAAAKALRAGIADATVVVVEGELSLPAVS